MEFTDDQRAFLEKHHGGAMTSLRPGPMSCTPIFSPAKQHPSTGGQVPALARDALRCRHADS